jgi:hypothetical protein
MKQEEVDALLKPDGICRCPEGEPKEINKKMMCTKCGGIYNIELHPIIKKKVKRGTKI